LLAGYAAEITEFFDAVRAYLLMAVDALRITDVILMGFARHKKLKTAEIPHVFDEKNHQNRDDENKYESF
jgi:hypothetical protein